MVRKSLPPKPTSRAVTRPIESGNTADCGACGERVKFQAKVKAAQIICNIYNRRGQWVEVVHYHEICYEEAGEPYGAPDRKKQLTDEEKEQRAVLAAERIRLWDEARAQGIDPATVALPQVVELPQLVEEVSAIAQE